MTYPNDPNLDGRNTRRAEPASRSSMPWILGGAAAVALIAFLAFSMTNRSDVSQNTSTPAASNTTTGSGAPGDAATRPQGQTGPLNTGSGGAPAASPQGETPPNMQSNPAAPASR